MMTNPALSIWSTSLRATIATSWERLRALRSDLINSTIAMHHGRVFKRTGDGALVELT